MLPMVTSNTIFFVHGFPVLKSRDCLACFMIEMSISKMVAKLEAKDNAWSKGFSEMDG
jgi:hypothetical protein